MTKSLYNYTSNTRPSSKDLWTVFRATTYSQKISPDRHSDILRLLLKRKAIEWSDTWITSGKYKYHLLIWYYEGDPATELVYDCTDKKFLPVSVLQL